MNLPDLSVFKNLIQKRPPVECLRQGAFAVAALVSPSAEAGCTARAGQHAGGRHFMSAGGAIEPVAAVLALGIGQTLFTLAFRAFAVHFSIFDVFFEQQPALGTSFGVPPVVRRFAIGGGADEYGLTVFTPVLAFGLLLAHWTFFHMTPSNNGSRRNRAVRCRHAKGVPASLEAG